MARITTPIVRKIIDDFAKEIKKLRRSSTPPKETVIDFRNEINEARPRNIFLVPISILRYRKDNGRISSDVMHYEKIHGVLDETDDDDQKVIRKFLEEKDKEKSGDLQHSMDHAGQREPAIITCDGFLINGNRRKMVMEKLLALNQGAEKYKYLKVVILPGKDDEDDSGGPPTQLEIEQIENRYQLQKEAKAEYYSFDEALSIRRKIELGMTLKEQLRDDPVYAALNDRDFNRKLKHKEEEYLKPLECIDRYLDVLSRPGLYSTVSRGLSDPEGRWQAFLDYYQHTYSKISDDKARMRIGLDEEDVGKVEDVAFKIMRKRHLKGLSKVHSIMRDFYKYIGNEDSKKELFKLIKIDNDIPEEERFDEKDNEYNEREIDKIWGKKHEEQIIRQVNRAIHSFNVKKEKETPIDLLKSCLKKLNHEDMIPSAVVISDIPKAMKVCDEIKDRASTLGSEFYHYQKQFKKLSKRKS